MGSDRARLSYDPSRHYARRRLPAGPRHPRGGLERGGDDRRGGEPRAAPRHRRPVGHARRRLPRGPRRQLGRQRDGRPHRLGGNPLRRGRAHGARRRPRLRRPARLGRPRRRPAVGGARGAAGHGERVRLPAPPRAGSRRGRGPGAPRRSARRPRHDAAQAHRAARRPRLDGRAGVRRRPRVARGVLGPPRPHLRPRHDAAALGRDAAGRLPAGPDGGDAVRPGRAGRLSGRGEPTHPRAGRVRRREGRADAGLGLRRRVLPLPRDGRRRRHGRGDDGADARRGARRPVSPAAAGAGGRGARGGREADGRRLRRRDDGDRHDRRDGVPARHAGGRDRHGAGRAHDRQPAPLPARVAGHDPVVRRRRGGARLDRRDRDAHLDGRLQPGRLLDVRGPARHADDRLTGLPPAHPRRAAAARRAAHVAVPARRRRVGGRRRHGHRLPGPICARSPTRAATARAVSTSPPSRSTAAPGCRR